MNDTRDRRHETNDVEGYLNNPLLSPALNRLLDRLGGQIEGSGLAKPIDWQKAFEGATLYIPQ